MTITEAFRDEEQPGQLRRDLTRVKHKARVVKQDEIAIYKMSPLLRGRDLLLRVLGKR
jgi:hypothetical protein